MRRQKSKTEKTKTEAPQIKERRTGRNSFMLGIAGFIMLVGLFCGYLWVTKFSSAMFLGIFAIGCCVGGFFLCRRYWRKREEASVVIVTSQPVPRAQVNSLCIYPDHIVFEDVAKPEGQPSQCANDGKNYFVHIWNEAKARLEAFILPDQQYYDPGVFAQRVLELPAHRRIFRRKQSLFQKLSPFIMIIVIVVEWILIITTTGQ